MTELKNFGISELRNIGITDFGISDKGKTIWHRQLRCGAIKTLKVPGILTNFMFLT